jgi:hypothetical protein
MYWCLRSKASESGSVERWKSGGRAERYVSGRGSGRWRAEFEIPGNPFSRNGAVVAAGRLAKTLDAMMGYPRLKRRFRTRVGYAPNFREPQTFNEKINWRKLYDHAEVYQVICDKARMREYLAFRFGPERAGKITPVLRLVTDRPSEATLRAAGTGVAIKANHGSGWVRIVPEGDSPDWQALAATARGWLRKVYGLTRQEWAYWHIPPRILVEELVLKADGSPADDIKVAVMGGKAIYIFQEADRFRDHRLSYYTPDWQPLGVAMGAYLVGQPMPRPERLAEMVALAEEIGQDFDYIRVDILDGAEGFRVNELTIYRSSGLAAIDPPELDLTWGALWPHRPYAGVWPTGRGRARDRVGR